MFEERFNEGQDAVFTAPDYDFNSKRGKGPGGRDKAAVVVGSGLARAGE